MTYVQSLRLRNSLLIYATIVGVLFVLGLTTGHLPNAEFHIGRTHSPNIPLSAALFFSAFCSIIFATAIATSLNRENDGVEMVWTKPIARERLALLYIIWDFGAILIAFAFGLVLSLVAIASFGALRYLTVDDRVVPTLVIGLGVAFMWYGLLQGVTSWQRWGGGIVIGVSWGAAVVLMSFAGATQWNPPVHALFLSLDVLNPLAYFGSYSLSGYGAHQSPVLPAALAGTEMRSILTWSIGLLGCAAAIAGWKRLEV